MGASIQEVLLSLGDFTFDFDWDPDLAAELLRHRHLLVYEGQTLRYCGLILRRDPSPDGLTIGGRLPTWRLGVNKDGPLFRDKTWLSGANKLSNGDFSNGGLYWKESQGSTWVITTAATVSGDLGKDDALVSDESREAIPGAQYRITATAARASGTVGHLRPRTVYEGRFDPPDLLPAIVDWGAPPTDVTIVGSTIEGGPVTRPQVVVNGSFETGDLSNWSIIGGSFAGGVTTVAHFEASHALEIIEAAGATNGVQQDTGHMVKAGEQWLMECAVASDGSVNGDYIVQYVISTKGSGPIKQGQGSELNGKGWLYEQASVDISSDVPPDTTLTLSILEFNQTAGTYYFDYIRATRTKGNTAVYPLPAISVVPERTYKVLVPVTADANCTGGDFRVTATFTGTGRPDQTVVSSTVDYQQKARTLLDFAITPPSGYDTVTVSLVWTDVVGAAIVANEKPTLVDQDTSTYVVDVVTPATGSGTYTGTSTAPTGTEKVHVEIVAESLATGWSVDNVSLVRLGTTSTAAQVVTDCLTDQDTGRQLFTPGVLSGSDTILSDFHAVNLTNAEVLQAVARGGVALPEREWRYYPDNSFGFGTDTQLYIDRTDFTLRRDQLEVLQLPDVQETSEEQLTDVVVIGATRTAFNGRQYTITGSASVSPDSLDLDWNGNPIHRVRVVEDSTMDNVAAANAYAAYLLGRSNTRQSIQLSLSDWRGYADGTFDVGDWIYPYEPDSGLSGDTQVIDQDGYMIWPLKSRVLERTWKLGGGFSLQIRRPDGSLYDVPDELVRWEADTSASVTVGDLLPEFAVNDQGRSASDQFLRYRASTPG